MTNHTTIQLLTLLTDDEISRATLIMLAKCQGLSIVDQAVTEKQALNSLTKKTVDVVLLDLPAQDVDGIELTRQLRESHPSVRILISTASQKPEDIFAAMDAGADGYVLKGNHKGLEMAIRSVRLGTVWLDPGIAAQVLEAMVAATSTESTRILQTGMLCLPLMPDDKDILKAVAGSSCTDGVCMVDPSFMKKLRRFAPSHDRF